MTGLTIARLSERGEGIGDSGGSRVHVPFAVPGDTVEASITGDRGAIDAILSPSADRVAPFCPYWTHCGGCATQTVALRLQLAWKRDLVVQALARAGITAGVAPGIDAHGAGRRRATFHARRGPDGHGQVGFMAARSHVLVPIDHCPLFAPEMRDAVPAATAVANALASSGKPLDIAVTATPAGLDVDVRGNGPLDERPRAALIRAAERIGLARVSNHGRTVVNFRPPRMPIGDASVELPPGSFLQATQAGEDALARLVMDGVGSAAQIADLFSGIGTFALRLAARATVHAVESNGDALQALQAGASNLAHPVTGERRDLVRRPLVAAEFARFDAVVFDPPRAGALDQVRELAKSTVRTVVGVSCNPQTFARDAKVLVDGGFVLSAVTPVDQFRHSPHVEIVGVFRRAKARAKRSLLG